MTLPQPVVPLVYSLHYIQQGHQDWKDGLAPENMQHMKKQEKGKSNLHAAEDFSGELESMNLDPLLSKLIHKYHEVFGALPPPCLAKSPSTWTSNSEQSLKGLW